MEQIVANTRCSNTAQAFARAPREALEHIESIAGYRLDEAMRDLAVTTGGTDVVATRELIGRWRAQPELVHFADAVAASLLPRAT